MNPPLFIGMPVFNGGRFIGQALDSLISQTYRDWMLLISDNDSTDGTAKICKSYCERDARIRYIKQPKNQGTAKNYRFLLESAHEKYFMWAAADDLWEPEFLDANIRNLESNLDAGAAFSNIVNIDSFGQIIREIPSFGLFATKDRQINIGNYVLAPEFLAKVNLFYSIYRLSLLKDYLLEFISSGLSENPGSDKCFVLGVLCRTRLVIDERVLFKKRFERKTDQIGRPNPIPTGLPYLRVWPRKEQDLYFNTMRAFSANTPYAELVENFLQYRMNLNHDLLELQTPLVVQLATNTDYSCISKMDRTILQKIKYKLKQKMNAFQNARKRFVRAVERKRIDTSAEKIFLRFYSQFVTRNSLCFDVGANIGNCTKIFLKLGASVVAVEPQIKCADILTRKFGDNRKFTLIRKALGADDGTAELQISNADTISSLSPEWINSVKKSGRFRDYLWEQKQVVPLTTLDSLIRQYGNPDFIKIDVEGYEYEVIKGLTYPVRSMSFEFTPEYLDATLASLEHLRSIGQIQLNYSIGESMEMALDHWVAVDELMDQLNSYKDSNTIFGDVYVKFTVSEDAIE